MPWFDLSEEELRSHRTATVEPAALDDWWRERLREAGQGAGQVELSRHGADAYGDVEVHDVTFPGWGRDPVRAWYLRPARREEPLPVVVRFIGYGGGRGVPVEHLALPAVGLAAFVMDTRGQGGSSTVGATGDPGRPGDGPEYPGVMTRGLRSPETYYFTRLYVDAARAVEVAGALDGVDGTRLAVWGNSQGGALALAAAALRPDLVRVCHANVPFLCDIARAVGLSPEYPYKEVADFLAQHVDMVDAAMRTFRYVDAALLARRVTADCLLSVGLMDEVCPPSTVFAAYNEIPGPKEIAVYPFGVHDVPTAHAERQLRHLMARFLP